MIRRIGLIGLVLIFNFQFSIFNSPAYAVYEVEGERREAGEIGEYFPGEFIVRYREKETPEELAEEAEERARRGETLGGAVRNRWEQLQFALRGRELPEELLEELEEVEQNFAVISQERVYRDFYLIKSAENVPPGIFLSGYQRLANVQLVEPHYVYRVLRAPNDEHYGRLWGMRKIGAEQAWDATTGVKDVLVAVVDAGIDPNHEDLRGNFVHFRDLAGCRNYYTGHGTHTAGTVGAVGNNGIGVAGVAWEIGLIGVNISCYESFSPTAVARGIDHAVAQGARVINLSVGGPHSGTIPESIGRAVTAGVVIVTSAGNTPGSYADQFYPARDPRVITVSATGPDDRLATYSSYGQSVDVAAPGGQPPCSSATCIVSAWPGDRYTSAAGTSMAAPHVAGLAGLLLSKNAGLSVGEIKNAIYTTADDLGAAGKDTRFGHGRVNAGAALAAVGGGVTPTATPSPSPSPTATPVPTATPTPTTGVQPTVTVEPTVTVQPTVSPTNRPTDPPTSCALNGDYDGSGTVDGADFTAWEGDYRAGRAGLDCFEYWRRATYGFGGGGEEPTQPPATPSPTAGQAPTAIPTVGQGPTSTPVPPPPAGNPCVAGYRCISEQLCPLPTPQYTIVECSRSWVCCKQ